MLFLVLVSKKEENECFHERYAAMPPGNIMITSKRLREHTADKDKLRKSMQTYSMDVSFSFSFDGCVFSFDACDSHSIYKSRGETES